VADREAAVRKTFELDQEGKRFAEGYAIAKAALKPVAVKRNPKLIHLFTTAGMLLLKQVTQERIDRLSVRRASMLANRELSSLLDQ
jgi:hypothetical protein